MAENITICLLDHRSNVGTPALTVHLTHPTTGVTLNSGGDALSETTADSGVFVFTLTEVRAGGVKYNVDVRADGKSFYHGVLAPVSTIVDELVSAGTLTSIAAAVWLAPQSSYDTVGTYGILGPQIAALFDIWLTNYANTVSDIGGAVWNAPKSAHTLAGSYGLLVSEIHTRATAVHTAIVTNLGSSLVINWNAAWATPVQSAASAALVAINLDHLMKTAVTGDDVGDNTVMAKLVSNSATADWDDFVNTTSSLRGLYTYLSTMTGVQFTSIPWSATWHTQAQIDVAAALATFWTNPATLVDLIWDEPVAGHTTLNTTGDYLINTLDVSIDTYNEATAITATLGIAGAGLTDIPWTSVWTTAVAAVLTAQGLTTARAAYLDNLNIGENVAGTSEVTSIQNNTRCVRVVPEIIELPATTREYRVELLLYDAIGNMEAPDSTPTIELVNEAGTDQSGRLDSTTMTLVSTGRYRAIYTTTTGDAKEQLVWSFSVVENASTRLYGNTSMITDAVATDFTATDRSNLLAIKAKTDPMTYTNPNELDVHTVSISAAVHDSLVDDTVDGVWDELRSEHTTIGSFGESGLQVAGLYAALITDWTTTRTGIATEVWATVIPGSPVTDSYGEAVKDMAAGVAAVHTELITNLGVNLVITWNNDWDAEIASILVAYEVPTETSLAAAILVGTTAVIDEGTASWGTATGFSTHSVQDIWLTNGSAWDVLSTTAWGRLDTVRSVVLELQANQGDWATADVVAGLTTYGVPTTADVTAAVLVGTDAVKAHGDSNWTTATAVSIWTASTGGWPTVAGSPYARLLALPTAAQNAYAVWEEMTVSHTTVGSYGYCTLCDILAGIEDILDWIENWQPFFPEAYNIVKRIRYPDTTMSPRLESVESAEASIFTYDAMGAPIQTRGATAWSTKLRQSYCLSFGPASSFVTIPHISEYEIGSDDFQLSFWFKAVDEHTGVIFNKGQAANRLSVMSSKGQLHFSLSDEVVLVSPRLALDAWHYVECARDSIGCTLRVDGEVVASADRGTANLTSTTAAVLGKVVETAGELSWAGQLANFRWTRNDQLILHLPLAEGAGVVAHDASPYTNHGDIMNPNTDHGWGERQDNYHYNLQQGCTQEVLFDRYQGGLTSRAVVPAAGAVEFAFTAWDLATPQVIFGADDGESSCTLWVQDSQLLINFAGTRRALISEVELQEGHYYAGELAWDTATLEITLDLNAQMDKALASDAVLPTIPLGFGCQTTLAGSDLPASSMIHYLNVYEGDVLLDSSRDYTSFCPLPVTKSIDVYLVAGGENAAGEAPTVSEVVVPTGKAFEVTADFELRSLRDPTGSAWPGFCQEYTTATGRQVALVLAAESGSAQHATAGTEHWDEGGQLYPRAVAQTWLAMNRLATAGYQPHLCGILWCQGEQDAIGIDEGVITKEQYQQALETMLDKFQAEFPGVQIYLSRTGRPNSRDTDGFRQVREVQLEVATALEYAHLAFSNAIRFPKVGKMGEELTYSAKGYDEMGSGLAKTAATKRQTALVYRPRPSNSAVAGHNNCETLLDFSANRSENWGVSGVEFPAAYAFGDSLPAPLTKRLSGVNREVQIGPAG